MGMLRDKAYETCIEQVAARSAVFIAARPDCPRALEAQETADVAARRCAAVKVQPEPYRAAQMAMEEAGADGVVLACGSLYMIGECKRAFEEAGR